MKENKKVLSNVVWHFAEKWGSQILSFLITIVISRKVEPSEYGHITIVNAFISLFSIFIDGGLGNSLIQKKDSDDLDFSTVFYTNLIVCTIIYSFLFVFAPYIAIFYNDYLLKNLIRVSGIVIIISALKNIQQAYVYKKMEFKNFFFSSLFGTLLGGIVGIIMAIKGYGAWALVFSNLTDVVFDTLIMWFTVKWKPIVAFSFDRLKKLFDFGSKMLFASIVDRVYNKAYHLGIGKFCPSSDLAFYEKGYSVTSKISDNTNLVVSSMLFPALSNYQDE